MRRSVGRPTVSVPVLSMAKQRMAPSDSRCAPPLIRMPWRAARATPASTAAGVLMASAQGDAPTRSVMARRNASGQESQPITGGRTAITTVAAITAGT